MCGERAGWCESSASRGASVALAAGAARAPARRRSRGGELERETPCVPSTYSTKVQVARKYIGTYMFRGILIGIPRYLTTRHRKYLGLSQVLVKSTDFH